MNLKKLINDWWMSPDWAYQSAHFLLGMVFVIFPFWITQKIDYAILGTAVLIVYGTIKEILLDPKVEDNAFLWDGFEDMSFLFLGSAMPWLIKLAWGA